MQQQPSSFPPVTVVIPAMNEAKYLPPCITSFSQQTSPDFTVVVVSLSTDNTDKLCQAAGWKIIKQQGKGVSSARSQGFAQSTSDIIASTDADTAVCHDWISQIQKAFLDPDTVCVYGPTFLLLNHPFYTFLSYFSTGFQLLNRLFKKDTLYGMNFAVRKTAYEQCGGFDTTKITAEDMDLGFRIRRYGKIKFVWAMQVHTSPRRLFGEGPIKFITHHLWNFFSMHVLKKASSDFKPIR